MKDYLKVLMVLLVSLGACSTVGTYSTPTKETYTLTVENQSWEAKTLRVFCGQTLQKTFRGLVTSTSFTEVLKVCDQQTRLVVEYLGQDPWVSPAFSVYPDQHVRITIAAFQSHNSLWGE